MSGDKRPTVEELRREAMQQHAHLPHISPPLREPCMIEALADRLEEAERERDEATEALKMVRNLYESAATEANLQQDRRFAERYRLQAENERLRIEIGAAWFRCSGCGEYVRRDDVESAGGHTRSEHHPRCRGLCSQCPVPVACGPVVIREEGIGEPLRETGGEKGGGRD